MKSRRKGPSTKARQTKARLTLLDRINAAERASKPLYLPVDQPDFLVCSKTISRLAEVRRTPISLPSRLLSPI